MATEVVHRVRFVSCSCSSLFSTIFPMIDFQNFNGCCLALPRAAEQALKSSHSLLPPATLPLCSAHLPTRSSQFPFRSSQSQFKSPSLSSSGVVRGCDPWLCGWVVRFFLLLTVFFLLFHFLCLAAIEGNATLRAVGGKLKGWNRYLFSITGIERCQQTAA